MSGSAPAAKRPAPEPAYPESGDGGDFFCFLC